MSTSLPDLTSLSMILGAAATLGTACYGIVEALKWTSLGDAGYGAIKRYLGEPLLAAIEVAFGPDYQDLLKAQYRQDSQQQSLIAKTLRQGVRIGLTVQNAAAIAKYLGSVSPDLLVSAATSIAAGNALTDGERDTIGRFELAADARIDSALSRAKDSYLGTLRCTASVLAILMAEVAALLASHGFDVDRSAIALVVGVVAVPLAPVANDLVGALQAATKALKG